MKIVIDIPKEFESHYNSDKFEDSLKRIAVDIRDGLVRLSGNNERELIDMLIVAFKNSKKMLYGL